MFKAVHSQIRLRTAQDFIDIVERVMIHVKHAPVDLAKDRNGVACMSTKHEGGLILDWRLEREFGTRK